jgi:hypothetical protein
LEVKSVFLRGEQDFPLGGLDFLQRFRLAGNFDGAKQEGGNVIVEANRL